MKIGIVVGQVWPVPPEKYGGTERVAYLVANGLKEQGHTVELFAAGDSSQSFRIHSTEPTHLGPVSARRRVQANSDLFELMAEQQKSFDIFLSFCDEYILPYSEQLNKPILHSLHMPFSESNSQLFLHYSNLLYISLSYAQRKPLPELNYVSNIYNGVDVDTIPFSKNTTGEPCYLGAIHPWKGVHLLVDFARRIHRRVDIAGPISDSEYFKSKIKPFIGKEFNYLGEMNDRQKYKLFEQSKCLLYPVQVNDTCPLTPMEAGAAGLPVIAYSNGSLPEIIKNGTNGYLVTNIEEMVEAYNNLSDIMPANCRKHIQENFNESMMVEKYNKLLVEYASV